jgi:beta-lactamase superfamily II metal-dependent hydrolase
MHHGIFAAVPTEDSPLRRDDWSDRGHLVLVARRARWLVALAAIVGPFACGKSTDSGAPPTGTSSTKGGSGGSVPEAGAGASGGTGPAGSSGTGGGGAGDGGTGGSGAGGAGGNAGQRDDGGGGGGASPRDASTDAGSSSGGTAGTAGAGQGGRAGSGGQAGAGGAPGVDGAMPQPLRIFWIDVEGGAATLIGTPTGETILVDAGWAGDRDANRIVAVLKNELRATRLDYMITTHYHADHVGGVAALAALFPIARFVDHGDTVESGATFNNYLAVANAARTVVKPGDKLAFGGAELTFVTAAGQVVDPPLSGAIANPHCAGATMKSDVAGAENPMSVGFVLRYGKFDFVDLGDLTWNVEQKLMCPTNRIGPADLYQVSHHGMDLSSSPQLVHGLAPIVAVMNNGATKGGAVAAFDVLRASPGLGDIWAIHRVTANDAQHNADEALTANVATPDAAHGIRAVVLESGTFTVTNDRNGTSRTYTSR